ncbi:TPA: hypothetical protein HA297_05755 [Candidatus Woesearchaeota archaeon]|nr:hypothetical protein [Candidatus Woesearchaeota archaeon]
MVILQKEDVQEDARQAVQSATPAPEKQREQRQETKRFAVVKLVILVAIIWSLIEFGENWYGGYLVKETGETDLANMSLLYIGSLLAGISILEIFSSGLFIARSELKRRQMGLKGLNPKTLEEQKQLFQQLNSAKTEWKDRWRQRANSFKTWRSELLHHAGWKEKFSKPYYQTTILGQMAAKLQREGLSEAKIREKVEAMGWKPEAIDYFFKQEKLHQLKNELQDNEKQVYFDRLKKEKQKEDVQAQQQRFRTNKERAEGIRQEQQQTRREKDELRDAMQDAQRVQKKIEQRKEEHFAEKVKQFIEQLKSRKQEAPQNPFHFVGDANSSEQAEKTVAVRKQPEYHSGILMKHIRKLKEEGKTNEEIRRRLQLLGLWDEELIERHLGEA